MNKKIVPIICLSLILTFCVPYIPALADASLIPGYYTKQSVSGLFTGNFTYDGRICSRSEEADKFYSVNNDAVSSNIFSAFEDVDITGATSYFLLLSGSVAYLFYYDSTVQPVLIFDVNSFAFAFPSTGGGTSSNVKFYSYHLINDVLSYGTSADFQLVSGNVAYYYTYTGTIADNTFSLLYASGLKGVYSKAEAKTVYPDLNGQILLNAIIDDVYTSNSLGYTNFWDSSLPYYDGTNIVDPDDSVGESNSNHLYLNDFNIGFCKPYHMENLYSAGGAYCYFTYNFDSWVNSHSSDYEFQIITQLNVDGTTNTYNSIYGLDLQGCTVLPFKGLATGYNWNRENVLFVEYEEEPLFNNYNRGYVYCIGYDKYIQPSVQNTLFRGVSSGGRSTRTFVSSNGSTHRLLGEDLQSEENYFNGESSHSQFLFTITVHLVDKVSGDVSGSFVKTFNLLTGVSNVTSNSIRDNTNPYQISDDDIQLPVIDSGGGYDLIAGYGTNNQIVTFTSPDNIKLFIDNGLKDFVVWYNTDSSVGNAAHSFWNNMGIFKDNPASSLYQQYFGFLPDDFKDLILGACGIGIVGGAFCILRRKLT